MRVSQCVYGLGAPVGSSLTGLWYFYIHIKLVVYV